MGDILFLAHRVPWPPDRGDKIRSHHLLKSLAQLAPVHLACFGESDADMNAAGWLNDNCASHCLVRRSKPMAVAGAQALLRGLPVSLTAFHNPAISRFVERTIAERNIETVFVFSGQMGQYIPASFGRRVVIDLCDVDSAKFEAYAKDGQGPRSWIDAREGRLLASEERKLARRAAVTLLVSESEAELLRQRIDAPEAKVAAVSNGIDATHFDPAEVSDGSPYTGEGPHFVFTGQMDYAPNVAAAQRAARHILPLVRKRLPASHFHIVGRAPTGEVRALDRVAGVTVWGEVADVRPFIAHATAMVAPLAIARGVQNKVLEGMAMKCAVVLTPQAATGIGATDGEHLLIGERDEQLAEHLVSLCTDPAKRSAIAMSARKFVLVHKSWDAQLAALPQLVLPRPTAETRDAA
ncbi:TIGR03087 family PEP-CTERM/XrtA system glycosyltransferase [Altererythrobacter sp. CAU 1778]